MTMGGARPGHSPETMRGALDSTAPPGAGTLPAGAPEVPPSGGDFSPRRLYDSHFPFVWRNLRRLGVPDALLEDASQDVFLVVHRRWESFDSQWSAVETWLFGILMRVARNHRRSLKRRGAWVVPSGGELIQAVPSGEAGPADLVARREAIALLDRLLDALDEDKRAILILVDIEQLSAKQAAEALGLNLNTAYWRLRAARGQLRKALTRIKAAEKGNGYGGGGAP